MARSFWLLILAAVVLSTSCTCTKSSPSAEQGSELVKYRAAHKKKRKYHATRPSSPPTRDEGQAALAEARALLEETNFPDAEKELRIAAAAGVPGADDLLAKVRAELGAEEHVVAAEKKMEAHDWEGARSELGQVPSGLILSDVAQLEIGRLDQLAEEARKQMVEQVADRVRGADAE
jgi:hypothetical protein